MFKGLSLRIWLPFTIVLGIIALVFNFYYPSKQESFYVNNKNNELKELAKTVGLGVELSLSEDNFNGLKKTLDFASKRKDFEFIAIVLSEDEKERVFASYPQLSEQSILKRSDKYFYQKSAFASDDFAGYILIAASKAKMSQELAKLNKPIYYSTFGVFFISFLIYIVIAKRITRPLNELVVITEKMGDEQFAKVKIDSFDNDEIGRLGRSISDLQEKLIEQRNRNKELYDGLEEQIQTRTKELAQVTEDLIDSQKVASIANYTFNLKNRTANLPKLFFELLGIEAKNILEFDELEKYVHSNDKALLYDFLSEKELGSVFEKEIRFLQENGNLRWITFSGSVKLDLRLNQKVIRGLLQDITDRKNYENEINRLSLVAKNTSNCVIITDASRKIIWANDSAQRITEYTLDEMIGKSPKMFQFEKTDPKTIEFIKNKLSKNENINCEILNRSKNGREYWLDLNIVPLFNEIDELYGYIAVETDITDIKNTSIAIEEREKQLRNILDNSAEMIHTLDEQGNVLWANRSWKENLKVTDEMISEKNIIEFLDANTKLEFDEIMPRLSKGEKIENLDCGFYSTDKELVLLKGQAIPLFKDGKFIGSQAYLHNVTKVVKAERELKSFSEMQEVLMEISFDFLNADPIQIQNIVEKSIKKLGEFIGAKRCSVLNFNNRESVLNQTVFLGEIDSTIHPKSNEAFDENDPFIFTEKIPLVKNNLTIGEMQLDFASNKKFISHEIELLNLFSAMLVNVESRYLSAREISEAKYEIERINTTLENKVLENTKRNLELSKTLVDQEKMATIGEISAGIAHDLNTPLGAIKIGAESISYSLDSMFKLFPQLNEEELELLFKISRTRKIEIFVGGLQLLKESKEMNAIISPKISNENWATTRISELLVKCRVDVNESELIDHILCLKKPEVFLEILYTVLTTHSMLSSVSDSVNRASEVVQNIRSFIKKDVSNGLIRKDIKLQDNIKIVLNIFSYEFKRNVDLSVEIDDHLTIKGFDVKLFQLWSNLIKNAIDAMEDCDNKKLIIKGKRSDDKVLVSFSNSGPMIPTEIQQQIFKKFYSTKRDKNGTGLGLSIVQSVVHEHNAKIHLESTEDMTTFTIEF